MYHMGCWRHILSRSSLLWLFCFEFDRSMTCQCHCRVFFFGRNRRSSHLLFFSLFFFDARIVFVTNPLRCVTFHDRQNLWQKECLHPWSWTPPVLSNKAIASLTAGSKPDSCQCCDTVRFTPNVQPIVLVTSSPPSLLLPLILLEIYELKLRVWYRNI